MADNLSPLDPDCENMILIGRYMTEAHHVLEKNIGPSNAPFAQKMPLGWVVIGNMFLNGIYTPDDDNAYLTHLAHLAPDGRTSIVQPCSNNYDDHESFGSSSVNSGVSQRKDNTIISAIFGRTVQDDKSRLSIEDGQSLTFMKTNLQKDKDGNWCSPLPFSTPRGRLPNNRAMGLHRAESLEKSFHTDPLKQEHILTFMQKEYRQEWEIWQTSLTLLENVKIRRLFTGTSISIRDASKAELHTFSDASDQAIAAVATLSSSGGIVCKVRVHIIREGKSVLYIRPVTELVILVSE